MSDPRRAAPRAARSCSSIPGHGGRDPGATGVSGTVTEKQLTLAIARELADLLAETRPGPRGADPRRRRHSHPRAARRDRPPHRRQPVRLAPHGQRSQPAGARQRRSTRCPTSRRAEAARFAQRREPRRRGAQQRSRRRRALDSCSDLALARSDGPIGRARAAHRRPRAGRVAPRPSPHQFAAFQVLRRADTPAVLVEAGYISNVEDEALLATARAARRSSLALGTGDRGRCRASIVALTSPCRATSFSRRYLAARRSPTCLRSLFPCPIWSPFNAARSRSHRSGVRAPLGAPRGVGGAGRLVFFLSRSGCSSPSASRARKS